MIKALIVSLAILAGIIGGASLTASEAASARPVAQQVEVGPEHALGYFHWIYLDGGWRILHSPSGATVMHCLYNTCW